MSHRMFPHWAVLTGSLIESILLEHLCLSLSSASAAPDPSQPKRSYPMCFHVNVLPTSPPIYVSASSCNVMHLHCAYLPAIFISGGKGLKAVFPQSRTPVPCPQSEHKSPSHFSFQGLPKCSTRLLPIVETKCVPRRPALAPQSHPCYQPVLAFSATLT